MRINIDSIGCIKERVKMLLNMKISTSSKKFIILLTNFIDSIN